MRSHAADVALIGLAIEQSGASSTGVVAIELNAVQVAAALLAHYERDDAIPIEQG